MKIFETQPIDEKVEWAIGNNIEHASRLGRKDQQSSEYETLWLNIDDIFHYTDKSQSLDVRSHTGGENSIGSRVEMAKQFWLGGGKMDLAIIGWNEHFNNLQFTDGRHRLVAAYQLGDHWAPVLVEKNSIEKIKDVVRTKWLSEAK